MLGLTHIMVDIWYTNPSTVQVGLPCNACDGYYVNIICALKYTISIFCMTMAY